MTGVKWSCCLRSEQLCSFVFTRVKENELIPGAIDGETIVWKLVKNKWMQCEVLSGHDGAVIAVSGITFREDNSRTLIAIASADSTVRVWNRNDYQENFKCLDTLGFNEGFVFSVALSNLPATKGLGKPASQENARENETATLAFVGDINFDGPERYYAERALTSYNSSFEFVAKYIREADYSIGNLESPFGTNEMRKYPVNISAKNVFLLAHTESVQALKFAGVDCVTLANNHNVDFGEDAVRNTLETLRNNGIDSFGFNRGKPFVSQVPVIKTIKGIKVGFLGYCLVYHRTRKTEDFDIRNMFKLGMAIYSENVVAKDIKKLKEKVDIMVVYMHWGGQYHFPPSKKQKEMSKFLISLGVHVIVGAHPHVIQGHGYYEKSFLTYSIGHFIFGQRGTRFSDFQSLPGTRAKENITREMVLKYENSAVRSLSASKDTLILKISVTKNGSIFASYLPCEIQFNVKKKSLQAVPRFGAHTEWIEVCGKYDTLCLNNNKLRE